MPSPSPASHEGQALLLHPTATVLWQHLGQTVAAVKIGWPGFTVTLVSIYVPPLTDPHRTRLGEAGLLPTEAASLTELGAVLELLSPQREPVLIMGDFNARTAALAPSVEGQLPRVSTDPVLNTRGRALLSLLQQHALLLLSGTTPLSCQATSIGGSGPEPAKSVVDYAIAS